MTQRIQHCRGTKSGDGGRVWGPLLSRLGSLGERRKVPHRGLEPSRNFSLSLTDLKMTSDAKNGAALTYFQVTIDPLRETASAVPSAQKSEGDMRVAPIANALTPVH